MQDSSKKDIIIIGGGGHAKVLIDAIVTIGIFNIKGILDPKIKVGTIVGGFPVIGSDELLFDDSFGGTCLALGVGIMKGSDDTRRRIYARFSEMKYVFPAIRHGTAIVARDAVIGDGVQIMAGAIVQPCAKIGSNSIVNTSAVVEHDCNIAAHCHIAPGAILGGGVSVGEESMVGLGARVLPGVKIGRNVTVGAGTIVLSEVEDGKTVINGRFL